MVSRPPKARQLTTNISVVIRFRNLRDIKARRAAAAMSRPPQLLIGRAREHGSALRPVSPPFGLPSQGAGAP